MFVFVNANERPKTLPRCKSFFLSNFVYIHLLLVSRPIVLKSWYLTERNAVWESLVICRACHHEDFLKFGNSASALHKPAAEERAQCSTSFKSLHNFTEKGHMGHKVLETQHFLFFSHFFLFSSHRLDRPWGQRKCRFYRFFSTRSDFNNRARGILFCYRLQGVFS